MRWFFELHRTQPVAHAIGVLSFVCVLGMALGSMKFRGIGLGTAGVLFAGIALCNFGEPVVRCREQWVVSYLPVIKRQLR